MWCKFFQAASITVEFEQSKGVCHRQAALPFVEKLYLSKQAEISFVTKQENSMW